MRPRLTWTLSIGLLACGALLLGMGAGGTTTYTEPIEVGELEVMVLEVEGGEPPAELCSRDYQRDQKDPSRSDVQKAEDEARRGRVRARWSAGSGEVDGELLLAEGKDARLVPHVEDDAGLLPFAIEEVPLLQLAGPESALQRVQAVFEQAALSERIVRIAVWGDSHVAGEMLTGELRRLMQDRYGDAGYGFAMPARPVKWHRTEDTNSCSSNNWRSD